MTIYTKPQRILIVILVSLFATLSGFASNIYLSSIPSIATDLSVSIEAINLTVTGYMIFQALTPTFWGALSDSQGRRIVYICTLTIYLGACIGLALTKTYAQLLVLRCLQSSGSASTIAMGAGVIGDISSREERGGYMGYFQAGLLLPVAVGPLVGGALQNALGWHAVFWFLTVYGAVCLLLLIVLLPETLKSLVGDGSVPLKGVWTRSLLGAVQQRRLKRMKPSADHEAQVETTKAPPGKRLDLLGPFRILLSYEAAIAIFFIGIHYTVWQMVLTILPTLFESTYRLSSLQTGLVYIANGAGCIIGTALTGKILDADYRRIKVRYTDDPSAFPLKSARLRLIWVYAPMQCAAVLVFGWTLDKGNLEKRNVSFSKDGGMRVGVKGMKEEDYADKTQDYLVKAWNYSSLPAYKSRLWNKEEQVRQKAEAKNRKKYGSSPAVRPASARSTSGAPDVNVPRETRASRSRSSGPGAFPDD
ncbi:hypothetical protein H2203_007016 [Taxawa tesnikishii (nom. ined.)]|nr:hypothetical protein H2203_007016 [Dothideales sp. JES 119]